jgi:succinyl-diaminopimelate desuccinylase
MAPEDSRLVRVMNDCVEIVRGTPAELVVSPGTYDQKHVAGIAGITQCVAYGPGELEQAHQPDESCAIDDMVAAAQVMALTVLELAGQI